MDELLKKSLEWCENHSGWEKNYDISYLGVFAKYRMDSLMRRRRPG